MDVEIFHSLFPLTPPSLSRYRDATRVPPKLFAIGILPSSKALFRNQFLRLVGITGARYLIIFDDRSIGMRIPVFRVSILRGILLSLSLDIPRFIRETLGISFLSR